MKSSPDQNATGLQVTSAVIAGMGWALENPEKGIVETDEIDSTDSWQFKNVIVR